MSAAVSGDGVRRFFVAHMQKTAGTTRTSRSAQKSPLEQILGSKSTQTILNGVIRGMFGTGRR